MNYKYFKITEKSALDDIEKALKSIEVRGEAIKKLTNKLGANNCLQWSVGGIASFTFDCEPDRNIWKKVKHGFMPKAKTKESKLIGELPKEIDYRDIIERYGFGREMIIGDRVPNGNGFRMESSYLKGNRLSEFYAIVVPYQKDFDREVHDSLEEIKEWEMLKAIDED